MGLLFLGMPVCGAAGWCEVFSLSEFASSLAGECVGGVFSPELLIDEVVSGEVGKSGVCPESLTHPTLAYGAFKQKGRLLVDSEDEG